MKGLNIGIELVVMTAVGTAVGLGLDKALGTVPFLTILFMILGMVGGLWLISRENRD